MRCIGKYLNVSGAVLATFGAGLGTFLALLADPTGALAVLAGGVALTSSVIYLISAAKELRDCLKEHGGKGAPISIEDLERMIRVLEERLERERIEKVLGVDEVDHLEEDKVEEEGTE